jgi:hypothetical protein
MSQMVDVEIEWTTSNGEREVFRLEDTSFGPFKTSHTISIPQSVNNVPVNDDCNCLEVNDTWI